MTIIMDNKWLTDKTKAILDRMDPEVYPEACEFLNGLIEDDSFCEYGPFGIANELADADKDEEWTPEIVEYLEALYMEAINAGDADAMNDLGAHYYDGHRGFEQSFDKAMKYYKMAAYNGSQVAQENLGYCYYYGRDGEPDYMKAFHYFAMGAFSGYLNSLYKIGDMYYNGYYVEKNLREAFVIYMRCLDMMTEEAERYVAGPVYLRLGKMFLNGYGVEKNLRSALTCFQKAEHFLYSMVVDDRNLMYKKSLEGAIEGQAKVREEMAKEIPEKDWLE